MSHTASKPAGEPVSRTISAETMKMPDPIIEPATIVAESKSERAGLRARDEDTGGAAYLMFDGKALSRRLRSQDQS